MNMNTKLPSNEQIAQYLDQDVPMQQLESEMLAELPPFMRAQFDFAKSKQGKKVKQNKQYYQMKCRNNRGVK